ncbi:MAG: rhodanese-like domain-containing protein, partial [Anaerococcus vaginalis]|nr:rhodanese-like domain-containing protein [Anaerococcus vaginalis]
MKKSNLLLVSIFTSLALLTGCSQNNAVDNTSTEIKSNEASTQISKYQEMKGEQLDKIEEDNKKKEDYLVIDVRSEEEYKEGHVKHAINIPLDDADKRISEISDYKEKNVVTICNTGKKSSEMAKKLVDAGFKNV